MKKPSGGAWTVWVAMGAVVGGCSTLLGLDKDYQLLDGGGGGGGAGSGSGGGATSGCAPKGCQLTTFGVINDCGTMIDCGGARINAVSPEVANTGDTIALSGRFAPGAATVNFPGGVSIAATVSEATRVLVTVPFGASAGDLTVTSGDMTTNAAYFRRASFKLGVQTFRPNYDQGSYARLTPRLVKGRNGHGLASVSGRLFVFGGQTDAGIVDTVEGALINADGTLGPFVDTGVKMVTARRGFSTVTLGDKVYLLGGSDDNGGNMLSSVERTVIGADGTPGAFVDAGVHLTVKRGGASAVVVGNFLYVIGGNGLASIDRAPINPDGTLGEFADAGVALVTARHGATAFVVGNDLYVAGGVGNAGYLATIEKAPIAADGTLGAFVDTGMALPRARAFCSAAHLGSLIALIGGRDEAGPVATLEQATVDASGALGAFTVIPGAQSTPRVAASGIVVGNYFYVIGGTNGAQLATVEMAQINTSSQLGTFASVPGITLTTSRLDHAMAVVGNYVYMLGGRYVGTLVERALVHPDGSLGPFVDAGTPLAVSREYTTAVVHGGYLSVVGGESFGMTHNSFEQATIAADGALGMFADPGLSSLGTAQGRSKHAIFTGGQVGVFLTGGSFYSGGTSGTYASTTYSYAQGPNNRFGPFNSASSLADMPKARAFLRTVTIGPYVYALGGDDVSVARADLKLDQSQIGTWAANSSLANVRYIPSALVIGDQLYVIGGFDNSLSRNDYERATVNADGSLGAFAVPTGASILGSGRSNHTGVVIGNYLYLFGGVNGTSATSVVVQAPLQ